MCGKFNEEGETHHDRLDLPEHRCPWEPTRRGRCGARREGVAPPRRLQAAWIGLPEFTLPVVDVTAIVLVSPIAFIVVIEHIGHLLVIGEMTHRNYNPILWRSLLGDGLAITVAGFLGAPPATTFSENTACSM